MIDALRVVLTDGMTEGGRLVLGSWLVESPLWSLIPTAKASLELWLYLLLHLCGRKQSYSSQILEVDHAWTRLAFLLLFLFMKERKVGNKTRNFLSLFPYPFPSPLAPTPLLNTLCENSSVYSVALHWLNTSTSKWTQAQRPAFNVIITVLPFVSCITPVKISLSEVSLSCKH